MTDGDRGTPRGEQGTTGDGVDGRVPDAPDRSLRTAPPMRAFDDRLDSTFTVHQSKGAPVEVRLTGLDVRSTGRESDWRRFSLYFDGPEGDGEGMESILEQDTYRVTHPAMDPFDVSLIPVSTDDPDPDDVRYEAVFTRHVPDAGPDSLLDRIVDSSSRRGFLAKAVGVAAGLGLLSSGFGGSVGRASAADGDGNQYIASIEMTGLNFAPAGWALCEGQILPISQNTALFSLIGTQYGGDGRTTFGLPDFRGRVPIGEGNAAGLTPRYMGDEGGREAVSLSEGQLPAHTHDGNLPVSDEVGDRRTPAGNALAAQGSARGTVPSGPVYTDTATNARMNVSVGNTGGGQAHDNMPPFQTVNFMIALSGIYPSRS